MVPKKGLEPPHPCEYMDLNHARLPIPPRWQKPGCDPLLQAAFQEGLRVIFYRGTAGCQTLENNTLANFTPQQITRQVQERRHGNLQAV